MVLQVGTPGPNGVRVRLEPTANIRSAFAMNSVNIFGRERVEAPSANGWLSGIALLPGLVVTTGAGISSASAASRSLASAYSTPCPAHSSGLFAASSILTAALTASGSGAERCAGTGV